ncbi:thiol-activated cytolysin family protein [Streptomyces inhibens]|uniref:thiol-activated cytolysin family protein n=1 Tax=Streptomyces inhibens TaxID=2293571 RepID=UPI0015F26B58|nr:thiol-activated cytolysin family protein [Streptomyces inhibens]
MVHLPAGGGEEIVAQSDDLASLILPKDIDTGARGQYVVLATAGGKPAEASAAGVGAPGGKADQAGHLSNWKKWSQLAPHNPDEKKPRGEKQVDYVNGVRRTRQSWTETKTRDEIVTFNPSIDMLHPGAIVQADPPIRQGYLVSAQIEDTERAPLRVSVDVLSADNSKVVQVPSHGSVLDAIKGIVRGKPNLSPDTVFRKTEGYSSTETALQLGLSGSCGGFSGSLDIEGKREETQNTLVVYLRERDFTASCDLSTPDALINDAFTEDRATQLINRGTMGQSPS